MNLKDGLLKQHDIGQWWGRFALAGSQIAIFVSGYTFIMVSINAYNPVDVFLANYGIAVPFWDYMAIIVLPIIIAYVLSWKFLVRSFYLSWANQFWQQSKEYLDSIETVKKQNIEIIERLSHLEKN